MDLSGVPGVSVAVIKHFAIYWAKSNEKANFGDLCSRRFEDAFSSGFDQLVHSHDGCSEGG